MREEKPPRILGADTVSFLLRRIGNGRGGVAQRRIDVVEAELVLSPRPR